MVSVRGPSSEAFASALSKAFGHRLKKRTWVPLRAELCDAEHLQGLPMLRPLGPELSRCKYDLNFLRTHCAVLDTDGKIDSLYIAMGHTISSWKDSNSKDDDSSDENLGVAEDSSSYIANRLVALNSQGHNIHPNGKWTRIRRELVSAQALQEADLIYEAQSKYFVVLGVLNRGEIGELARKSLQMRVSRKGGPPSKTDDQRSGSLMTAESTHSSASTTDKETGDFSDLKSLLSVSDMQSLTTGTTFSSLASQVDIPEAIEELAKLLLKDEELGPLFRASLQRTAADKVERNYIRLLTGFARDLRKEATNPIEHQVGRLVKFKAHFISQTLISAIDPSIHDRRAQMENFLRQNEHTTGRQEQVLEYLATSGDFVEATKGAPPPIDSDANMSDDSGEEGSLPKLSQIKEFILSSKALATLRKGLKDFVSPEKAPSGVIQKSDTEGNQGAQGRSEGPLDGRLSNLEFFLGAVIRLVTRIDQRTLSTLTDSILKSIRPRIPEDHQRISWICVGSLKLMGRSNR